MWQSVWQSGVANRRGNQAWQSGVAVTCKFVACVMATSFGVRGCPGSANRSRSGWRQRLSTKGAACAILGGHTGDRREILGSSEGDQRERRDGRHLGTAERAAASSLVHKDGEGDHHVDKSNGLTCGERGTHTRSEAVIRGHQRPLEAIRSHQRSGHQRPSSNALSRPSEAIRGHQACSELCMQARTQAEDYVERGADLAEKRRDSRLRRE